MFKREAKEGRFLYTRTPHLLTLGDRARVSRRRGVCRGGWVDASARGGTSSAASAGSKNGQRTGGERCRCVRRKGPLTAHAQFEAMERRVVYCCILKRRSVRSVNAAPKGGRSVGPDKRTNLHAAAECSETAPFRRIVRGTTRVPWSVDATAEGASRRVSGGAKHPALGVAAG